MSNDQTTPTPASLADTTVLPRLEVPAGWRLLEVGERIEKGDMACSKNAHSFELGAVLTVCYDLYVCGNDKNAYFRPIAIDPAPHTAPKAPADPDTSGCDHEPECITMYEDGRMGQIQCSECGAPMEAVHSGEQAATRHELIAIRATVSTLTAQVDSLAKERDAYKDDALALVKQIPPLRFERDNLQHQVESLTSQASTLTDTLSRAREALDNAPICLLGETPIAFIERYKVWYRENRRLALESPALAKGVTK